MSSLPWFLRAALFLTLVACGNERVADAQDDPTSYEIGGLGDEALPLPGTATEATRRANALVADQLDTTREEDAQRAARGFLAKIEDSDILDADGNVVWRINDFDFLDGPAPATANPALWVQSRLTAVHGLFEVTDGLYQVRGYDLSVMSVIRGETGWIIVDPLTTVETAAAALKLVQDTLGERPISAMIYTHSHADHFGGAGGILANAPNDRKTIPIIAPNHFTIEAVTENLIAGPHMARRATLMYGSSLERGPGGSIGSGLGPSLPDGTIGFVMPTEELSDGITNRTIDGVRFEFVDAAGTEAPAEFMFYLPDMKALCSAEVVSGNFHNVLTMRGAKIRDSLTWSKAIDGILLRYGEEAQILFASHHWPIWGQDRVSKRLRNHRDLYRNVHDQTVRLANLGNTIDEVSDLVREPTFATEDLSVRGYYGSTKHNAKAVYQFYFGWWGGVPAEFDPHPPEARAKRLVAAIGGAERTQEVGEQAFGDGDYRWAAEVFTNLVFSGSGDAKAEQWLAATYEQLGFQAESGAVRNYFLSAARELRSGIRTPTNLGEAAASFLPNVPTEALFNALSVRYDPSTHDREPFELEFRFPDTDEVISVAVGRDIAYPRLGKRADEPAATVTITRDLFNGLLVGQHNALGLLVTGKLKIDGDRGAVTVYFDALVDPPDDFAIVTP